MTTPIELGIYSIKGQGRTADGVWRALLHAMDLGDAVYVSANERARRDAFKLGVQLIRRARVAAEIDDASRALRFSSRHIIWFAVQGAATPTKATHFFDHAVTPAEPSEARPEAAAGQRRPSECTSSW